MPAPGWPARRPLIDGEMVVQDEHGITDFNALRSAIYTAPHRLVLFAFDLLHLNGKDCEVARSWSAGRFCGS